MHADNHAMGRGEDGASEAREPLGWFWAHKRLEREWCSAPSLVDWNEVDRE